MKGTRCYVHVCVCVFMLIKEFGGLELDTKHNIEELMVGVPYSAGSTEDPSGILRLIKKVKKSSHLWTLMHRIGRLGIRDAVWRARFPP